MNKEILKKNIMDVIMQPCVADCPVRIVNNGLSEDGKYIFVKVTPDDSCHRCLLTDDLVENIIELLPEKYRDKLVTLRHHNWVYYSYCPVFDTDTQEIWDKEYHDYMQRKQEWFDKYGCD